MRTLRKQFDGREQLVHLAGGIAMAEHRQSKRRLSDEDVAGHELERRAGRVGAALVIARNDDALPGFETREHLQTFAVAETGLNRPWTKPSLTRVHEDKAAITGVEHGRGWHHQPWTEISPQLDAGVHPRQERIARIGDLDAGPCRPRSAIEEGGNEGDRACEALAGEIRERDLRRGAALHELLAQRVVQRPVGPGLDRICGCG